MLFNIFKVKLHALLAQYYVINLTNNECLRFEIFANWRASSRNPVPHLYCKDNASKIQARFS